MLRIDKGLYGSLNLRIIDLILGQPREVVENIENLKNNIIVLLPSRQGGSKDLVAVHLYHSISYPVIATTLYSTEQLDNNPFLFALHESRHDLSDTLLIQAFRLNVINVFLIILPCFLLPRSLSDCRIPTITIINPKSFNRSMRQFRSSLSLSLASNIPRAIRFTTITGLWISTISIDVVIENQLFPGFDVSLGKNAHAQFLTHHPFVHVAIRIARMIAKSTEISFLRRIHELTFREGHEIEMLNAFFIILNRATSKCRLIDDFSDILEYEVIRL